VVRVLQGVETPVEVQDCPREVLIKDQSLLATTLLRELADTQFLLDVRMLKVFGSHLILDLNGRRLDRLLDNQENLFIDPPPQGYLGLVDEAGELPLRVLEFEGDGPEFDEYDLEILALQEVREHLLVNDALLLGLQGRGRVYFEFFLL
jgi:hypothetical protein